MKTILDYRKDFLCVLIEFEIFRWAAWRRPGQGMAFGPRRGGGGGPDAGEDARSPKAIQTKEFT